MASSPSSVDKSPPKAASLLGLAVEIRSEIFKHLVGGVILHVSSNCTRRPAKTADQWFTTYSYFVCCDVNAEQAAIRDKKEINRRFNPGDRRCEYLNSDDRWDSQKYERDDRVARQYFHKAIAGANRQLYEESCWAFLEYNTFSFCEPVAWQQFRDDHSAAELDHMRAIELFTMTPEGEVQTGQDKRDPYERTPRDCRWRFDNVGILKNVTTIVLGLRDPRIRYDGIPSQKIETIGAALDWAFGDLGGLKRLKEAKVFIILNHIRHPYLSEEEMKQITDPLSILASNLEAKLLALNPHNVAQSTHKEETQPQD